MKRRRTKDPIEEKETEVTATEVSCGEVVPRVIAGSSLVSHRALVSPNGKWLLCICGSEVRIYSCSSGDLQSALQESPDALTGLAFNATSPHSQIYSVSCNGRLVVWNYEEGVAVKAYDLKSESFGVYCPYGNGPIFVLLKTQRNSHESSEKVQEISGLDTSCSLFQISSLDGLSRKKGLRSIMRELSSDCHKVTFDPQGDFLAVITDNALCLYFFKRQQYKKHLILGRQFTCIAVHPKERCIATGDSQGRILLWRCFEEHNSVTKSIMHWHSASVLDLAFSSEGSYLWSGGWESTLVQWSLNQTDHKDFIPRMGAAIVHLSISYDNNTIVVSHADSVITLVGLQRNILCTVSSLYWQSDIPTSQQSDQLSRDVRAVLAMEPVTKSLVLRGKPGQLQIYNPIQDKLLSPIDVVGQNVMSSGLKNLSNAAIDAVAFGAGLRGSPPDQWMCTADSLSTKHVGSIINLKFWLFDHSTKRYILKTSVVDPHDSDPVRWIVFSSNSDDGMVATLSDTNFKIWMAIREKTLSGTRLVWSCIGLGHFGDHKPLALAFAPDGATLAVAFRHLVTFWDVETVCLADTALVNPHSSGFIRDISYGPAETDVFLVTTDKDVSLWNLSSMRLVKTIVRRASFFTTCPEHSLYAVCSSDSVAVLDARTSDLLYEYTFPTDPMIISCLMVPCEGAQKDAGSSGIHLLDYRLFLLSAKGEMWIVDDKGSKGHGKAKKLYALEDEHLSAYAHLKATALVNIKSTDSLRNGLTTDRRESFLHQLSSVPAYTLPKPEYYLTEHLNSLLGMAGCQNMMKEDEEMDMHSDQERPEEADALSDQEDINQSVRLTDNGAVTSSMKQPEDRNLDENFNFLIDAVALLQPALTGKKARTTDTKTSLYSKMSHFYQEIRSHPSA